MSNKVKFVIDGKECQSDEGKYLVEAAKDNGVYIPTLCNYEGLKPKGSCRICTVKINGRLATACTSPVHEGMKIENYTAELNEVRKEIIELLFVSGNHFCPACEKSGNCELQALGYRYEMMAPRFPFAFPIREVDASYPRIIKEQNRCILCKRCMRGIKDEDGKSYFAYKNRGKDSLVVADRKLMSAMSPDKAKEAMEICPVGSILVREKGWDEPIGTRKYDNAPIGSEIENK
ncbi:MAG TPA: 2Fe-2S iron-sulfur cluster binding domain-containing protein [Bacteroides sp.]|nr:2Fe-2S iron-sulfur cluster binding domain-containing protein [Bacteroides sp.]